MEDTMEINEPLTEEEQLEREKQLLMVHGDVFHQLMQHPRFKLFLQANYDIQFRSDEESKNAGFVVMEVPHAEVATRLRSMLEEQQAQEPKIVVAGADALEKLK